MKTSLYPWQAALWTSLAGRTQQAHAYLLHGPKGSGKRAFAEHFAAFLLCRSPRELQPCGQCAACKLYAANTHPDLLRLEPEEDSKGILIASVRELIDRIMQTSQQGGRQVVIVEPAEAMTTGSANALLKSLEEPAGATIFLLISHQFSFLLPTIKSRCVLQNCPLPSEQDSLGWLQQQHNDLSEEQCRTLLSLASGSPLNAQKLLDSDVLTIREQVVEGVKQLFKQQSSPSDLAAAWSKIPPELLFDWFCQWAQLLLRYKVTEDEQHLGLSDMRIVIKHVAPRAPLNVLLATQDWLLEHRQKVLQRVPLRADLLLEGLLVRWQGLLPR
ncbi:MAG TPA: DNA polymerase III subunit delta' [Thiopseudomonas sp.]|nr:DNA polymerase III subunit delta' [Thiopseudomonas sp.]